MIMENGSERVEIMRLIDADAAVKTLQSECDECVLTEEQREAYCGECGVTEAMNVLWDAPAVDAAPVVFCRDCEHWGSKKTVGGFAKCALEGAWHGPEFYCGNGNRREAKP